MSPSQHQTPLPDGLPRPLVGGLRHAGYETLESLAGRSARALLTIHGVGPKGIRMLRAELAEHGLADLTD